MPEEHIENVPPAESHETNVVNTDDNLCMMCFHNIVYEPFQDYVTYYKS